MSRPDGLAVPEAVRRGAEESRLGRLLAVDQAPSPARRVAVRLVAVVAAVLLAVLLSWLIEQRGAPGLLRYVALLALFLAFVPFGRALRDLVVGADTTCAHERGLALGNKRACTALTWRRTRSLQRLRASGTTLLGWDVLGADGRTHRVLLKGRPQQRADLATALEASAARARVRITEQD